MSPGDDGRKDQNEEPLALCLSVCLSVCLPVFSLCFLVLSVCGTRKKTKTKKTMVIENSMKYPSMFTTIVGTIRAFAYAYITYYERENGKNHSLNHSYMRIRECFSHSSMENTLEE